MVAASLRIEIFPNCSLGVRGALLCLASAAIVPGSVAGVLALRGFWPVAPFVVLELALLAWALKVSLRRRFEREIVIVTRAQVCIESRARGAGARVVFPRHWAQVKLRRPAAQQHPSRLTVESHGRQCELGSFLTEEERRGLALRLERLIGGVNESPSWP
ncbi:MAG: DUF2244 domain-containing protein [Gammaproteobacteria bacterium]|nr:DUF2244 domain-containing protein [Gammaproteobacteria bacterium]